MVKNKELYKTALTRFDSALEDCNENYERALKDIEFAYKSGAQWSEKVKEKRKGSVHYEFNKVRGVIRQIVNDQRQNRSQINVQPNDGNGDTKVAKIFSGLIKNIEVSSGAEYAYDTAFEPAVAGGIGYLRVLTDYESDRSFYQELRIKAADNAFSVLIDPAANERSKQDMRWAFVYEDMPIDEFKSQFGDKPAEDFKDMGFDSGKKWSSDKSVRIAEYFYKEPVDRKICLMSNGTVIDKEEDGAALDELAENGVTVIKERTVKSHKVMWCKLSGHGLLEEPREWPSKYIPIIPVYGERINIAGEEHINGATHYAKDAQRSYNYHRCAGIESIALTPKAPYLVEGKMITNFQKFWDKANTANLPYLPYNAGTNGAKPYREPPPNIPSALIQESQLASDDIKATTGIYDASLGARGNETSGKAIIARDRQGDVATFSFPDNLKHSIEHVGRILVDMIPRIYDTQRQIRIIGNDDKKEFVTINETILDRQTGEEIIVNDLSQGSYDVTVATGASYTTKRVEEAEKLISLASNNEAFMTRQADLIVKALDFAEGDEMVKRERMFLIQQGIIQPTEEDEIPPPDPAKQQQEQEANQILKERELAEIEATRSKGFRDMAEGKASLANMPAEWLDLTPY